MQKKKTVYFIHFINTFTSFLRTYQKKKKTLFKILEIKEKKKMYFRVRAVTNPLSNAENVKQDFFFFTSDLFYNKLFISKITSQRTFFFGEVFERIS